MTYNENEFKEVLEFCQQCPELSQLWAMSLELGNGDNSLELTDVSNMLDVNVEPYTDGKVKMTFTPTYPYTSTYYLVLYRILYAEDNQSNTEALKNMDSVCKWFFEAQENGNVPILSSEQCVKVELLTPRALHRMAYEDESGQVIQDFYISFRLHKVNPCKRDVKIV
jgi:hypothetical protein